MKNPIRIIQVSDIHLYADHSKDLLGVNTLQSFSAVLDLIRRQNDIDLIILSGDLSQDGSLVSYQKIAELLTDFVIPVYYFPGNHDNLKIMLDVFPTNSVLNDRQILIKNWQIILLDSQKEHAVEGYLDEIQFNFLKSCLLSQANHYAMIMLHHHPVKINSRWLDNLGLQNADKFWQALTPHVNAKAVVYGHVHQENAQEINGIPCISAPSTCVQFKRNCDEFALENLPQGFRLIELYEDGSIETKIIRLDHYVGDFDPTAKGY